jgi:phytoene desaturase
MSVRSAIVVGAGVGGLTAAMKLAHQGVQVDLFERGSVPGGRCGRIAEQGYTFDLGPTIMLMPFVFEEAFASVGRRLDDYLKLTRCDPNYAVTWRDGSTLTLTSDAAKMRAQLEAIEPGSFERFEQFLARGKDQHDTSLRHFVGRHFDSIAQFLSPINLRHALRIGAHQRLYGQVSRYFADERLRQALSFQTMYLGVSPYEAPAVFSLLPYTELKVGIWYPHGGMGAIPRALETVCRELQVGLNYRTTVEQVIVEGRQAVGVRLADGSEHYADVVVCNADLPWAYKHLLPKSLARPALEKKRYTASGFMMYLGLKRRIEGLLHHNIFFGDDFEGSFDAIFTKQRLPNDPSFYVNAPTRTDVSMAPAGHDALYVLMPVPHQTPNLDWRQLSSQLKAHVLTRLAQHGHHILPTDVAFERVITPDDWATQLNLERGSNFGLAQNPMQIGPLRPKVYDERVDNLFFCGASAQPGTGVPTVMISAQLAVEAISQRAVATNSKRPTSVRRNVQQEAA